ncbi:MAG: hypothetical protein ACE15E_12845 [Acidobacteriota bacterium]
MRTERGIALLVALIVAILLSLMALALTFSSMKELGTSTEFERHEKALLVADAGFNEAKQSLRGRDLSQVLQATTAVPTYASGAATWPTAARMPVLPIDARNIDFESSLPGATGSRTLRGLLTPPEGETITTGPYAGRYFAKVTDNEDEAVWGLPNDPSVDRDGFLYMRVVGVYRGTPGELANYGSAIKNSVAVIETQVKRDMSFNLQSPLSVYGQNVSSSFSGNSFKIDGYDHRGMPYEQIVGGHDDNILPPFPGISCLYNAPPTDAEGAVQAIKDSLGSQQLNNIIGEGSTPSIQDGTEEIRTSPNEDATNIFDGAFLVNFANLMAAVADYKYEDGTTLSGENIVLGTLADPKITVALGDLELNGNGGGAGIMIVRGTLDIGGSFVYDGVILVVGEGDLRLHGANKSFLGGIYVVNVTKDANGSATFGTPKVDVQGNSNFYMKSDSITMAYSLLPMRVISWVEITPEIEPLHAGY